VNSGDKQKSILARPWFRFGISGLLLGGLLYFFVDLGQIQRSLQGARWGYLGWLALWITLDRLLMTYKWRLLLICRGLELGFWPALKSYYLASFAGCFLPSTLGADAMRVMSVSGAARPAEVVAASVVVERTLGFVAAAIAALMGVSLLTWLAVDLPPGFLGWSLGILALGVAAVLFSLSRGFGRILERLRAFLDKRGGRLGGWLGRALQAYFEYRSHGPTLVWFLVLSVLEQSVPIVGTWLTALAFDIDLSLIQSAAVAPVALLFTRIPISVSGFGVVEGLYVALFALVGLNYTDSFILGLIANLSIVVTTLPGALVYACSGLRTAP
jgi:uncharacterized protein (TIRG00374 family)